MLPRERRPPNFRFHAGNLPRETVVVDVLAGLSRDRKSAGREIAECWTNPQGTLLGALPYRALREHCARFSFRRGENLWRAKFPLPFS